MKAPASFAVVGNPVAHSLSPQVHTLFAEQTGVELCYKRLLAPVGDFRGPVSKFFAQGGRGLNVTAPFKGDAADWVDELDWSAASTHSVNTIAKQGEAQGQAVTRGYSTDGPGLVRDLKDQWKLDVAGLLVLIIGAGGAVRGIIPSLLEKKPKALVIANRTLKRAEDLVDNYSGLMDCELSAQPLDSIDSAFDLIINGASGLFESEQAPQFSSLRGALCYDLTYSGKRETGFCTRARRAGAKDIKDGLGMLVCQAAYSFQIWHGVFPDTASVLRALR